MAKPRGKRYAVSGYYGTGLKGQRNRGALATSRSNFSKAYAVSGKGRNKQYRDISNTAKGRMLRKAAGQSVTASRRYGGYALASKDYRSANKTLRGAGFGGGRSKNKLGVVSQRRVARASAGRSQRRVRRNYRGQFAGSY